MKNPYRLEDQALPYVKKAESLPPLLARATLATAFFNSGMYKFRNRKDVISEFRQLGIPAPQVMAPFVGATEVACASLLGAGLLTRAAAIPLIPVMAVAILTAKRKDLHSFSDLTGIYEFSYLLLLAYLAEFGGGVVSADGLARWVSERKLAPLSGEAVSTRAA